MKIVVNIKLLPDAPQHVILKETLERTNAACNYLSEVGWKAGILRQYDLHKLAYRDTKNKFGIVSDMVIRCIAKVSDTYKLDKKTQRIFRKHSAHPYNHHILSFSSKADVVRPGGSVCLEKKVPFRGLTRAAHGPSAAGRAADAGRARRTRITAERSASRSDGRGQHGRRPARGNGSGVLSPQGPRHQTWNSIFTFHFLSSAPSHIMSEVEAEAGRGSESAP